MARQSRQILTSTTDTPEQIQAALNYDRKTGKQMEAAKPEEEVPAKGDEEEEADGETAEGEEDGAEGEGAEDEAEGEAEGEAEKAAKLATKDAKAGVKPKDAKKTKRGSRADVQSRMDYLTWQNKELMRQLEARPAAQPAVKEEPAAPAEPPKFSEPKPRLDDFETVEAYTEAVSDWTEKKVLFQIDQRDAKNREGVVTEEQLQRRQLAQQHDARLATYRTEHPEFIESATRAMQENLPMTPLMQEHFMHSDMGPALMHYLADNPDECRRIADLSLRATGSAIAALGRLEGKLERESGAPGNGSGNGNGSRAAAAQPPTAPKKKAAVPPPPPIDRSRGGSAGTPNTTDPSTMTHREYKAWRASGGGR